jgi:hypothetical protein
MIKRIYMQSTGYDLLGGVTNATFPFFTGVQVPPIYNNAIIQYTEIPEGVKLIPFEEFTIAPRPALGALFTWTLQVSLDGTKWFDWDITSTNLTQDDAYEITPADRFKWFVFRVVFTPVNTLGSVSFLVSGLKEVN